MAVARLYTAQPGENDWTYSGLLGAIVVIFDMSANAYFLRLVDLTVRIYLCNNNDDDMNYLRCVRLRCCELIKEFEIETNE